MIVQHGPSAGRPTHDINAEGCPLLKIDLALDRLGIAQ